MARALSMGLTMLVLLPLTLVHADGPPGETPLVFPCHTLVRDAVTGRPLEGARITPLGTDLASWVRDNGQAESGADGIVSFLHAVGLVKRSSVLVTGAELRRYGLTQARELHTAEVVEGLLGLGDDADDDRNRPFPGDRSQTSTRVVGSGRARVYRTAVTVYPSVLVRVSRDGYTPFEGWVPVWMAVGPFDSVESVGAGPACEGRGGCYLDELHLAPEGSPEPSRPVVSRVVVTDAEAALKGSPGRPVADVEAVLLCPDVIASLWGSDPLPFGLLAHSSALSGEGAGEVRAQFGLGMPQSVVLAERRIRRPARRPYSGRTPANTARPSGEYAVDIRIMPKRSELVSAPAVLITPGSAVAWACVESGGHRTEAYANSPVTYAAAAWLVLP